MDSYKLFRRRGSGIALCDMEGFDCLDLNKGENRIEHSWIRRERPARHICWWESVIDHYSQDEEADVSFYKHLGEVSQSLVLVLMMSA